MNFSVEPHALRVMARSLYDLTGDCARAERYTDSHVWVGGEDLGELFHEVQSVTDQVHSNLAELCRQMTTLVTSDGYELFGVADFYQRTDEGVVRRMDHKIAEVVSPPSYYGSRTYPVDTVPVQPDE